MFLARIPQIKQTINSPMNEIAKARIFFEFSSLILNSSILCRLFLNFS